MASLLLAGCSYNKTFEERPKPPSHAASVHERALVLDGHADIIVPGIPSVYAGPDGLSRVAPVKLRSGKVDAVVMSVAVSFGPRTPEGDQQARIEADTKLTAALDLVSQDDGLTLATTAEEIESAERSDSTAIILGFQNARSLQGDPANLDHLYNAGIRIFALNHIGHNAFSDSSRPTFDGDSFTFEALEEHGGLSELGAVAIKRINDLGGMIDVSQSSKAATLQIIELSRAPVIASHSNVRALSDVSRNLSDEEIDALADKGGVVHLTPFAAFLVDYSDAVLLAAIRKLRRESGLPEGYSYPYELYWEIDGKEQQKDFVFAMRAIIGTGSIERLVDHLDYIVKRVGIDHVGIGSDFNHGGGVDGFTDATEAANVTSELVGRGYSAEDIGKIWSGNFLRVMRESAAERQDGAERQSSPG